MTADRPKPVDVPLPEGCFIETIIVVGITLIILGLLSLIGAR